MDTALNRLISGPLQREGISSRLRADEFDDVVRENQGRIFRVLLSLLRDPDAADALTQECFLRAYRKRASFRGDASISTWLTRIAMNLAADYRKNRRHAFWSRLFGRQRTEVGETAALNVADRQPSAERALIANEQYAAVRAIVDELPPRQREVFLLRFAEELSLEEIAQATGLEIGTVKSHLHRALSVVRQGARGLAPRQAQNSSSRSTP